MSAILDTPVAAADVGVTLAADRAWIDRGLTTVSPAYSSRTAEVVRSTLLADGKRVRPLLSCAVLRALGGEPALARETILASELIHVATLLHDDVVDESPLRRGRQTAHLRFDVPTALLAGDFLLGWAFERLAAQGIPELPRAGASAVQELCEGEILERERRFDATVDVAHARRVNRLKTASLFGFAAAAGALLARATPAERRAAAAFGVGIGEAFQVVDDLLDWQGDQARLGKPRGHDLTQGVVTVPVAIATARAPELRSRVADVLAGHAHPDTLTADLERVGAFAECEALAAADTDRAIAALDELPPSPWRDHLAASARRALDRST